MENIKTNLKDRVLYMNPGGRDQWMLKCIDQKKIVLLDIQTEQIEIIPFLSKKEVSENFKSWLYNQQIRLPKTFIVNTKKNLRRLTEALHKLDLEMPNRSELKEYLVYHKSQDDYVFMVIENFENNLLPVIDYVYLRKVWNFRQAWNQSKEPSKTQVLQTLNSGIFNEVRS